MISSRTLLLFLIVLNLLALAWWSGAMSPLSDSVKEPQRLEGQIEPQRLKLVGTLSADALTAETTKPKSASADKVVADSTNSPSAPAPLLTDNNTESVGVLAVPFASKDVPPASIALASESASGSADALTVPASLDMTTKLSIPMPAAQWQSKSPVNPSTGLPMVAAAISGPISESESSSLQTCMRFGGLSYIEAREIQDELLPIGATVELERADTGSYLVYIDPLPTEQLASRKRAQLSRLGVPDLQVIRSGYYRNGISLGLLRSLPLAQKHQADLAALGVSTMRIGPVNVASARYEIIVKVESPAAAKGVRSHEVLSAMSAADCDR